MTGAAHMTLAWPSPALLRARQLGLSAASWLVALSMWTVAPLVALWAGSQAQPSGTPSMGGIVIVVAVLAAANFALVALLRGLARAKDRLSDPTAAAGTRVPWLYGRPRSRGQVSAGVRSHAVAAARFAEQRSAAQTREPLVLVDGDTGTSRPWRTVAPHLRFGFEVLAGVLPRDGSIDGTMRAMDRAGWQTAHVVARPRDAQAAVDLARLGRARSLLILDSDTIAADPVEVATEIAERAACRSSG